MAHRYPTPWTCPRISSRNTVLTMATRTEHERQRS
jgi:hypothetical protein